MEDPVEKIVREALDGAGVSYRHDAPLDFECDGFAIEVKQFHSERTIRQLAGRTDVILIQGVAAANAFASLLTKTEWQPIETAPKDSIIILYGMAAGEISGPYGNAGFLGSGHYAPGGDYPGYDWALQEGDAYMVWADPTHWMPLPAPPTEDKQHD